jgi:hypothetical protein
MVGGECSKYWEKKDVYTVLVVKPEVKRYLGRPRHRWDYNSNIYLQEVVWGTWTGLIWLRIGTVGGLL